MAHEIEGNRMFSVKLEPWHKLGKILENPPTSAEAIKAAGMDWLVQTRKLFWEVPPKAPGVDVCVKEEIKDRFALVRDEDEKMLSIVSGSYKPLQNVEAFAWFDPIVQAGQASYETAGVLRGGRRVWILARLQNEVKIAGDEYKQYVLLTNGHDGVTGVSISPVNCRVVCANTLRIALGEGSVTWFQHTGDLSAKMEAAKAAFNVTLAALSGQAALLETLAKIQLSPETMDDLLNEIIGIETVDPVAEENIRDGETTEPGPTFRERMKERILELHETGMGATSATRGTAYGLLNSVTEFVDHYSGARAKDRGNYTLFGDGDALKTKALNVLSAYAATVV